MANNNLLPMVVTDQHPDLFPVESGDSLPTTLNVLTILTFIYSAFALASAVLIFAIAPFTYQNAVRNQSRVDQLPDVVRNLLGNSQVEAARLQLANRTPILLITLASVLLCFFGALQMRKLRKLGFTLYVIGDVLPLVNFIFFSSLSVLAGIGTAISFGIYLVFVILYATQLKYMK